MKKEQIVHHDFCLGCQGKKIILLEIYGHKINSMKQLVSLRDRINDLIQNYYFESENTKPKCVGYCSESVIAGCKNCGLHLCLNCCKSHNCKKTVK